MRNVVKLLSLCLVTMALLTGCGKQPAQQMSDAKTALDAAIADGGETYAKEELRNLNAAYDAALEEIKTEDSKLFKNFDQAKSKLATLKADADAIKADLPVRKEKARNDAITAEANARAAIEEAKSLLVRAPAGKDSRADIEAMKADIAGVEASLGEVTTLIDSEEYFAAIDKAAAIQAKAGEISEQVNVAMAKVLKK